ncbi:MAG: N-succinylarginine dihydrolase [Acidimicrobiales bacterium]
MSEAVEVNFDGLVGPTHSFAGLSYGNIASRDNAQAISNPRAAALQGIAKMRALHERGVPQGILPPHPRPDIRALRSVGFSGTDAEVLAAAHVNDISLLWRASSASAMWVANAATVSPSSDTSDGRVHITPANLVTQWHRAIEAPFTTRLLREVFSDSQRVAVHDPLPCSSELADEGAANHTRLAASHNSPGVELFVYGGSGGDAPGPKRFPARQTLLASQAVARLHGVKQVVFAQQSPEAIDAGGFHNDVVSVGNTSLFLMHEQAYLDPGTLKAQLREHLPELTIVEIPQSLVSLDEAVSSYLFNSQLVSVADGAPVLVAERRCGDFVGALSAIEMLLEQGHISEVIWVDLDESMRNGGGPACLRLRVQLTPEELRSVNPGFLVDEAKLDELEEWVKKHYREILTPADLGQSELLDEVGVAFGALEEILDAPGLFSVGET